MTAEHRYRLSAAIRPLLFWIGRSNVGGARINLPDSEVRIRQLERENAQLRQEKEILKKVLGIYSKYTK